MKHLRYYLYHAAVILAGMYVVFYLIDRVNTAMMFVNNGITKSLLLALAILTIGNTLLYMRDEKKRLRAARRHKAEIRRSYR